MAFPKPDEAAQDECMEVDSLASGHGNCGKAQWQAKKGGPRARQALADVTNAASTALDSAPSTRPAEGSPEAKRPSKMFASAGGLRQSLDKSFGLGSHVAQMAPVPDAACVVLDLEATQQRIAELNASVCPCGNAIEAYPICNPEEASAIRAHSASVARGLARARSEDSSIAQMLDIMREENHNNFHLLGGRIELQQHALESMQIAAVQMKGQVGSIATAVSALQNDAGLQKDRLAAMEAAITTLQQGSSSGPAAPAAAAAPNDPWCAFRPRERIEQHNYTSPKPMRSVAAEAVPFSMRREALFGNLGWDTDSATLLERAKEVLTEIGCLDMIESMKATFTRIPGSSVDIIFKTPESVAKAREMLDALKKVYRTDEPDKCVCIVIHTTRGELRPNRLVHRAADFLEDAIRDHKNAADTKTVTKDIRGKLVSLEGMGRVGGSIAGRWRWLPGFKSNYLPLDVLIFGKDWIEDE
jgi:hypothetical protein